ncbi:hypothetical protein ACLK17_16220 [Escherichia coli]
MPVADINAQNAIMHDGKASEGDIRATLMAGLKPPAAVRWLGE